MKILIVGKGGREHAMLEACRRSPLVDDVFVLPGNPGMENCKLVNIDMYDIEAVCDFAKKEKIDLTIVGRGDVLALGIKDVFQKEGLKLFGPTKNATRIESSRYYARQLMEKLRIPSTKYSVFTDRELALKFVSGIEKFPIAIKPDSFSKFEVMKLCRSVRAAYDAITEIYDENENEKILVEEYVYGKEFTMLSYVKEDKVYPLPVVKEYKRVLDNDEGEHTGGMGAVSPILGVTESEINDVVEKILKPMAQSMVEDGYGFEGFLYSDIVLTKDGLKVMGFNARLGDPESQVLLPRLKSDFVQNILDVMDGKEPKIEFDDRVCIGVVLASKGYTTDEMVQEKIKKADVEGKIYYMGVEEKNGELYAKGGRNLIVTAMADDFETAREKVYEDVKKVATDSFIYRNDIGLFK